MGDIFNDVAKSLSVSFIATVSALLGVGLLFYLIAYKLAPTFNISF
ncbi:hypothetical protein [Cytobacillus sp. IB215665]|nr:hypothetical protein [Cytobacillus sp. IB215665]MDX8367012.1 hypothetical protein [Cytobacillus sp. IB215665]